MIRKLLVFFLTPVLMLTAQIKVTPTGSSAIRQAQIMERKGQVKEAREIYYNVLEANPTHRQAFNLLKSNLIRSGELDEAIRIISAYISNDKRDISHQVELGELYYRTDKKDLADQYWAELETANSSNQNFYRSLTYSFARLSLTQRMDELVLRGRNVFNDPAFLAVDLANYYHSRGAVDRAVNEFVNHLLARPKQKKYVNDRILLLSDDEENIGQIEATLISRLFEDEILIRQILSSFYFKIRNYQAAFNQQRLLGISRPEDFKRWLEFANNLRAEKEFTLAITAYQTLLSSEPERKLPSQVIGTALLGMGQCFEDQIIPAENRQQLVEFFPDNPVFENHFYGTPDISTEPLENSFHLYDSVLVNMPSTVLLSRVHFRLGEIKYRITRDFDGARQSYETALAASPGSELRARLQLRIGDIFMAKGEISKAQEYFLSRLSSGSHQPGISPYLIRLIQSNLYAGDIESALTLTESTIAETEPKEAYFNDLMEIQDLIQTGYSEGSPTDQAAFLVFFQGEALIRQNKLSQAGELLEALKNEQPEAMIIPWAILRAAMVNVDLGDYDRALEITGQLNETLLADIGVTLAGEIAEKSLGNDIAALEYYHRLLEDHPGSILVEPVRFRIRSINQKRGS